MNLSGWSEALDHWFQQPYALVISTAIIAILLCSFLWSKLRTIERAALVLAIVSVYCDVSNLELLLAEKPANVAFQDEVRAMLRELIRMVRELKAQLDAGRVP